MKTEILYDSPMVYVGTYKKYNEGCLKGAWIDLELYPDRESFLGACLELHKDEEDPELMFQDFQCFPDMYYSESWIDEELWDWLDLDEHDKKILEAYSNIHGEQYADIDDALDTFIGIFDSIRDFVEEQLESDGFDWDRCPAVVDMDATWNSYYCHTYVETHLDGDYYFFTRG